jgi:molybdate transport system substrate-binding protein
MRISTTRLLALALIVLGAAGCTSDGDGGADALTVLAAASLTDAFTELADAFEAEEDGAAVRLSFGASSSLREQILAGAPADVFASADLEAMDPLVAAGLANDPTPFAANQLVIVVPTGNPGDVDGLADFARADLLLGLCAPEVPCGRLARAALAAADVVPDLDTNATDVRALLTQVASGDLDAGIVYRTDVASADGDVEAVEVPAAQNVTATYPIAVLAEAGEPDLAAAFVAFVGSDAGQAILARQGFLAP